MVFFKKIGWSGKYQDDDAIPALINYITRVDKTPHRLIGGANIDAFHPAESMIAVSEKFGKNSKIRLHHFIVTFEPSMKYALDLVDKIARSIAYPISKTYQIVYAVHEDTKSLHIHFVFNAVSFIDGKKYHGGKNEYRELIRLVEGIIAQAQLLPVMVVNYYPDAKDLENSDE